MRRTDAAPTALPLTDEVRTAITTLCKGDCRGRMAQVHVYRDASGTIVRLMYLGDLMVCSHPPASFHEPDGTRTAGIGTSPAGNEERAKRDATVDNEIAGLTETNVIYCGWRAVSP